VPEWFLLRIRDKAGGNIYLSHCEFLSLESAAAMGHLVQTQDGHTATILDKNTKPPTRYGIDAEGQPFPTRRG
jgi:hypothetical protein